MSNLFNKYEIKKSDGSPIDPNAQYFVLRVDTDPAARYALNAYALYIFKDDPQFAGELLACIEKCESASNNASRRTGAEWLCSKCGTTNMLDVPICQACFHPCR